MRGVRAELPLRAHGLARQAAGTSLQAHGLAKQTAEVCERALLCSARSRGVASGLADPRCAAEPGAPPIHIYELGTRRSATRPLGEQVGPRSSPLRHLASPGLWVFLG